VNRTQQLDDPVTLQASSGPCRLLFIDSFGSFCCGLASAFCGNKTPPAPRSMTMRPCVPSAALPRVQVRAGADLLPAGALGGGGVPLPAGAGHQQPLLGPALLPRHGAAQAGAPPRGARPPPGAQHLGGRDLPMLGFPVRSVELRMVASVTSCRPGSKYKPSASPLWLWPRAPRRHCPSCCNNA